ncbi:MAG: hypothetical protein P1U53_15115 [Sulfitobacter sp.]|nr:hypothetical protein [Sulfitobacter sp.]
MTRNDWILDVLADLKSFALSNELPQLAEQLDDTALIAMAEITATDRRTRGLLHGEDIGTGAASGRLGAVE